MISPSTPVILRGTDARYTVEAVYCTCPLSPQWSEEWARLKTEDGRVAYWLVRQLLPIEWRDGTEGMHGR